MLFNTKQNIIYDPHFFMIIYEYMTLVCRFMFVYLCVQNRRERIAKQSTSAFEMFLTENSVAVFPLDYENCTG